MLNSNKKSSCLRITGLLLWTVLILALMVMLSGCGKDSGGSKDSDVEIVESGYSLENASLWVIVHNGSDQTYENAMIQFDFTDADGNPVGDYGSMYIDVPYFQPGSTRHITNLLPEVDEGIEQIEFSVIPGRPVSEDKLNEITPVTQIEAENIQVLYQDGQTLEGTYEIKNDSDYDYECFNVYYLYKDENGKYCGGCDEVVEGLSAHDSASREFFVDNYNGRDLEIYLRSFTDEEVEMWKGN